MLNSLKAEGAEPSVLLWALTREIRTLTRIASKVSQGNRLDSALQQERVWDRRKPLFKGALTRLPLDQLESLLQLAGDIDRSIKGLSDGRVWDKLRELVLQLAGKHWHLSAKFPAGL